MEKSKNYSWIIAIGVVVLGVVLTSMFSIFEPKIKSFLGMQPKAFWQTTSLHTNNKTESLHLYQVSVYNDSDSSGDIVITLGGKFGTSDFVIKGSKTKVLIDSDNQNTYLKIDPVYPKETIEILLQSTSTLSFSGISLGSQNFQLEKIQPFPFEQEYKSSNFVFYYIWFFSIGFLVWSAYWAGREHQIKK